MQDVCLHLMQMGQEALCRLQVLHRQEGRENHRLLRRLFRRCRLRRLRRIRHACRRVAGTDHPGKMLVPLEEAFRGNRPSRREIGAVGRKEEGGSVEILCGRSPEEDAEALRNREGACRRYGGRASQGKKGTVKADR